MKILMLIVMFLFLGALFIISNNNLYLKESENLVIFKSLYHNWLSHVYDNSLKLTGHVVNLDWLPDTNETIQVQQPKAQNQTKQIKQNATK